MKLKHKTYDHSDARKIGDILNDQFIESLGIDTRTLNKLPNRNRRFRNVYVRCVFFDFLKLMIDDCIKNNHVFISPNKDYFTIQIREKPRQEQKRLLKRTSRTYTRVNIIKSNGKFYEFVLKSRHLPGKKHRKIRVGHHKYMEIIDNVNNGKRYFK